MVQILVDANGKANMSEFPKLQEYGLKRKPGYFERLTNNGKKITKIIIKKKYLTKPK